MSIIKHLLRRYHDGDESVRRIFAATIAGRARPPAVTRFITHLEEAARGFDHGP